MIRYRMRVKGPRRVRLRWMITYRKRYDSRQSKKELSRTPFYVYVERS